MKYRIAAFIAFVFITALTITGGSANAASDWRLKISAPASPLTSSSFNVQYTALAINASSFTVKLYQDGTGPGNLVGTQVTSSDPNGVNGNSGAFPVSAADGHHTFHLVAVRASDNDTKTADVAVDVNAVPPGAPTYLGKTRSGNTYTIKFTAPSDSDVREVRIYSSTGSTFIANGSTQVGSVLVSPGQTTSFTYTAGSSAERFHAVRAFDSAGNGSVAVGDPNIIVTTTIVGGGQGGGGINVATAPNGIPNAAAPDQVPAGQILGTSTTTPSIGNSTKKNSSDNNKQSNDEGNVLGTQTTKKSSNKLAWSIGAAIVAALGLIYWFVFRKGRNTLN